MSVSWADWSYLIIRAWHLVKHELSNDDEFSSLLWFCECRSYSIITTEHKAIVFQTVYYGDPASCPTKCPSMSKTSRKSIFITSFLPAFSSHLSCITKHTCVTSSGHFPPSLIANSPQCKLEKFPPQAQTCFFICFVSLYVWVGPSILFLSILTRKEYLIWMYFTITNMLKGWVKYLKKVKC